MITEIRHRKTPEEEELDKKLTELNELESELAKEKGTLLIFKES